MKREYHLVSADSHVVEPPDLWSKWLPGKLKQHADTPKLVRDEEGGDAWDFHDGGKPMTIGLVTKTRGKPYEELRWGGSRYDTINQGCFEATARVKEMQEDGVAFESHSSTHADLTRLSFAECLADLRDSREHLESMLGRPVRLLAYPRGLHDEKVRRAAAAAGYAWSLALPEDREVPGPHAVPRVGIHQGNGLRALRLKTQRWYLPLRTSRPYLAARRARGAGDPCGATRTASTT